MQVTDRLRPPIVRQTHHDCQRLFIILVDDRELAFLVIGVASTDSRDEVVQLCAEAEGDVDRSDVWFGWMMSTARVATTASMSRTTNRSSRQKFL